jgi:hypothetical protein
MHRLFTLILSLALLSLACALGGLPEEAPPQTPRTENRCGDTVCDGPENGQNCPQDCAVLGEQPTPEEPVDNQPTPAGAASVGMTGVVIVEIQLDRTPGVGDCGVAPWYSPDCTMNIKYWWGLHAKAAASAPVLIVPDGQERWVITSDPSAAAPYGIPLEDYSPFEGRYLEISVDPKTTNPECSASIEGQDFAFEVMGTREEGVTELIFSTNPVEHIWGNCGQAGFDWQTEDLRNGWAAAMLRAPSNLSFQMNETFHSAPGTYSFQVEIDTNPSPENRDHVAVSIQFLCMGQEAANVLAPTACPWE